MGVIRSPEIVHKRKYFVQSTLEMADMLTYNRRDNGEVIASEWRGNGVGMAMQGYRVIFLKECKTVQATDLV